MKNNYTVYKHTSPSGKSYIGITNNYTKRCSQHQHAAKKGGKFTFHSAIRKYGWEAFKHEIVTDNITKAEAIRIEALLIKELNTLVPNGYNMLSASLGEISSEELRKSTIANRKDTVKGYFYDKRTNEYRVCLGYLGKKLSFGRYISESEAKERADYLMNLSDDELLLEAEKYKTDRNKSVKGYCFNKDKNRWKVAFTIAGKVKHLGSYKTEQEAIDKVKEVRESM